MRKNKPAFSWDTDDFMKIHVLILFLTALWVIWAVKKSVDNNVEKPVATQSEQRPENK